MSQLTIIIFVVILIIYAAQVWLNKSKPIPGAYFYTQLFAAIVLLGLVWFNNEPARIEYKILLTAIAALSIFQSLYSYNKRKKASR